MFEEQSTLIRKYCIKQIFKSENYSDFKKGKNCSFPIKRDSFSQGGYHKGLNAISNMLPVPKNEEQDSCLTAEGVKGACDAPLLI